MRQMLVMANWKMHGSRASNEELLAAILAGLQAGSADVAVCPSFVHLDQVQARCAGSRLSVGAQDLSHMASGAYTGEVAGPMLADIGCRWCLVGHSERRQYHGESDDLLAAKVTAAVDAGLQPVLCVGETLEQRNAGEAEAVVRAQLHGALADQVQLPGLTVAYEPVWAIGTGVTASPQQAQEMHAFIRAELAAIRGLNPQETRLLYGGSVKPDNAPELFGCEDIDGALVGGASLVAADFLAIVAAAERV